MPHKIFIIACEPSGDLHGSNLVKELLKQDPGLEIFGLGGPRMAEAGVRLLFDMTGISTLGLGDVLRQYFKYRKIFYETLQEVERLQPDALVLIDSPAFNLRFAKKIKKRFPVIYYISPQIWAWGARRIHTIKKNVSKMIAILPFEVPIYEKAGIPCTFVGHPLLDQVQASSDRSTLRERFGIRTGECAIALCPGSRETEVRRILPAMLEAARELRRFIPTSVFLVTLSPNVPEKICREILKHFPYIRTHASADHFYDILAAMDFSLIASGTATLEAALLEAPFFLLYKASGSTYFLGRHLVRVKFLGLANLLAGKSVVPEFIQDLNPVEIANKVKAFLEDPEAQETMKEEFRKVRGKLGEAGASQKAARAVLESLQTQDKKPETKDRTPKTAEPRASAPSH